VGAGLFIPGYGAPASLYRRGVPKGWQLLELPSFRESQGRFDRYREFVLAALRAYPEPRQLGGHSMGGALAVLAAVEEPLLVERLVLVSPAGLPLEKPIRAAALAFVGQLVRGCYPPGALARMAAATLAAPVAALRLARNVQRLDLTPELGRLRTRGLPVTVVACSGDRLTTCTHCRRLAGLLAADYRELEAADGHIWPITQPGRLEQALIR
jgi:pimeloyl-ACP methyl ester carboxylesterase